MPENYIFLHFLFTLFVAQVCDRAQWPIRSELIPVNQQNEATRSISTPPWMGCQSIVRLPPAVNSPEHLGGKRYCESKESCPRTQRSAPVRAEQFSIECRKTKTKVITLANHKGHRQSSKPIKTRSKYMQPSRSAGKRARASHDWFWFQF